MRWHLYYAVAGEMKEDCVTGKEKNVERIHEEFDAENSEKAVEKVFHMMREKMQKIVYEASEGRERGARYIIRFVLFDEEKNNIFYLKENGGNDDVLFLLGALNPTDCFYCVSKEYPL